MIVMKNIALGLVLLFCLANPAAADFLVVDVDIDPSDTDTNPQWVTPSDPADEGAWLDGLLGFHVPFISKDEVSNPLDDVPANWAYAVAKYGVGKPSLANPDHWAIGDDGDFILELVDIGGLPPNGLSHVSYFGAAAVPEPTTMLLLGLGLIGLSGLARKKFRK